MKVVWFLIQTKDKHSRGSLTFSLTPIMSPSFGKFLNKLKHTGPSRGGSSSVDLGDTAIDAQVYRYRKQRGVNLGKEPVFTR